MARCCGVVRVDGNRPGSAFDNEEVTFSYYKWPPGGIELRESFDAERWRNNFRADLVGGMLTASALAVNWNGDEPAISELSDPMQDPALPIELYLRELQQLDLNSDDVIIRFVAAYGLMGLRPRANAQGRWRRAPDYLRALIDTSRCTLVAFSPGGMLATSTNPRGEGRRYLNGIDAPERDLQKAVAAVRREMGRSNLQRQATPHEIRMMGHILASRESVEAFRLAVRWIRDLTALYRWLEQGTRPNRWESRRWVRLPATKRQAAQLLGGGVSALLTPLSPFLVVSQARDTMHATTRQARSQIAPPPQHSPLAARLALQLFNHIAEGARYKTCANPKCHQLYVRQTGRATDRRGPRASGAGTKGLSR